jgi:NHL repeat-containing protein
MPIKLKSLWALPAVLLLAGCSVQKAAVTSEGAAARFPELELKEKLQRATASRAVPLTAQRVVKQGQGAEFVVPAGIAYSDSGDLYVSDNNAHTVHLWRSRTVAAGEVAAGAEAAQLKFPNPVQVWGGKLYVSDNDGIKVLSLDGRFERLLRLYFGIFNFAVTDKETIVASLAIRNPHARDPLVVELDQMGKVIRRFGVRRVMAGRDDHGNQAFVAVSGSRLVVAYKYRPVVEVYDLNSGELVRDFEINHPVFESLKNQPKPAAAPVTSEEQKLEPRYVAGVKVLGDSIFLCLHLPVPEVWEVNGEGKLLAAFRADGLPPAINIFGFDARSSGGEVKFAIGVVDPTWGASVSELSTTSS